MILAARNNFGVGQGEFSSALMKYFSIGDGLTDAQASNYYNAVQ